MLCKKKQKKNLGYVSAELLHLPSSMYAIAHNVNLLISYEVPFRGQ